MVRKATISAVSWSWKPKDSCKIERYFKRQYHGILKFKAVLVVKMMNECRDNSDANAFNETEAHSYLTIVERKRKNNPWREERRWKVLKSSFLRQVNVVPFFFKKVFCRSFERSTAPQTSRFPWRLWSLAYWSCFMRSAMSSTSWRIWWRKCDPVVKIWCCCENKRSFSEIWGRKCGLGVYSNKNVLNFLKDRMGTKYIC